MSPPARALAGVLALAGCTEASRATTGATTGPSDGSRDAPVRASAADAPVGTAPPPPVAMPRSAAPAPTPSAAPTGAPTGASCPADMALIPAGDFVPRKGRRSVHVDAFCLDRTEVTLGAYAACVRAEHCRPACRAQGSCTRVPARTDWGDVAEDARASTYCNGARSERDHHPMNCVSFEEAVEHCHARDARLPSRSEWEWAAQGARPDASYPWGNAHVVDQPCWLGPGWHDGTCAVGSHEQDQSPQGVLDLAGNVTEWVEPEAVVPLASTPAATAGRVADGPPPIVAAPSPVRRGPRFGHGASWYAKDDAYPRAAIGGIGATSPRTETFGFRCARTLR